MQRRQHRLGRCFPRSKQSQPQQCLQCLHREASNLTLDARLTHLYTDKCSSSQTPSSSSEWSGDSPMFGAPMTCRSALPTTIDRSTQSHFMHSSTLSRHPTHPTALQSRTAPQDLCMIRYCSRVTHVQIRYSQRSLHSLMPGAHQALVYVGKLPCCNLRHQMFPQPLSNSMLRGSQFIDPP